MKIPDLDKLTPNNQNWFVMKNIPKSYWTDLLDSFMGGQELHLVYQEIFKD